MTLAQQFVMEMECPADEADCTILIEVDGFAPVRIDVEFSAFEVELPVEKCQPCPAIDRTFMLFAVLVAVAAGLMM